MGELVDANAPLDDVGTTRVALPDPVVVQVSPEERAERERRRAREQYDQEAEQHSPFWDALYSITNAPDAMVGDARRRTGERISRAWGRFRDDPVGTMGAAASGAMQGISGGLADEVLGLAISNTIMGPEDPAEGIHIARESRDSLRGRAPEVHGASEVGGMALGALAGPSIPATQAPGMLGTAGRVGASAATGALYGGASSVGYGDPNSLDEAGELAVTGGAFGAGAGALGGVVGETLRGPTSRFVERLGRARDDQLLGATTSAGRGDTAIRNFVRGGQDAVEARGRAAETLRETGAIPSVGTVRTVQARLERAQREAIETMDGIAQDMAGGGPTSEEIATRIRSSTPRQATAAPQREAMERLAEQIQETYGSNPVPYSDIVEEARRLRQAGAYQSRQGQTVSMTREGLQEVTEAIRGAYDDAVESALGADRRAAYQAARRRYAVLERGLENAETGTSAAAGNRFAGLSEQLGFYGGSAGAGAGIGTLLGDGGSGALAGAGVALAARGFRAVEPTLRASGADLVYRIAQNYPRSLGRYARVIQEAGARGAGALAATHYVLSQRDAEYRRLVQQFEEMQDEDSLPEAIRQISESGE
ncbi:hypothetical protein [Sandaracinus amylolyticus]|uniref:hypothetical protein n=1 Tax=Sandaracinus amylolyticus TaxID=927083 RepID=UPI001F1FE9C4|nr:hypothetical protein [Sandaracinus amylolyticus]